MRHVAVVDRHNLRQRIRDDLRRVRRIERHDAREGLNAGPVGAVAPIVDPAEEHHAILGRVVKGLGRVKIAKVVLLVAVVDVVARDRLELVWFGRVADLGVGAHRPPVATGARLQHPRVGAGQTVEIRALPHASAV